MKNEPTEEPRKLTAAEIGAIGGAAAVGPAKRRKDYHYRYTLPEARRKAREARERKQNK